MSGFRCKFCKGSLMKVHYPKLYNMAHFLALNVLLLPKDLTIIFIYMTITSPSASAVVHNIHRSESLTSRWTSKNEQINHDKHPDESKTRTHRLSKLPDDGDPWVPNNLLTPEQKKNTSWTPVGQATDKKLRSQATKMNSIKSGPS